MAKLLDKIDYPSDLRRFDKKDLRQISNELRTELIDVVSETGGHLGAGLVFGSSLYLIKFARSSSKFSCSIAIPL